MTSGTEICCFFSVVKFVRKFSSIFSGPEKKILSSHVFAVDKLYTFGSPRIGDEMFEEIVDKSLRVHGGVDVVRVSMLDRNGYADLVSMMPPTSFGYSDPKSRFSITNADANCPQFICRATNLHTSYFT